MAMIKEMKAGTSVEENILELSKGRKRFLIYQQGLLSKRSVQKTKRQAKHYGARLSAKYLGGWGGRLTSSGTA